MTLFDNNTGAEFSPCGKYRYKLWRIWDASKPKAMCIGLNPSKANADKNDATIRILIKVLSSIGYGGFYMMNLFAFISSNPKDLLTCPDVLGDNENKLKEVAAICDEVIVCWGSFKQAEERIKAVLPHYPHAKCFGKNQNGTPYHPLALMYNGTVKSAVLFKYLDLTEDSENYDENEFTSCSDCDGHDACEDFGCAIQAGIKINTVNF